MSEIDETLKGRMDLAINRLAPAADELVRVAREIADQNAALRAQQPKREGSELLRLSEELRTWRTGDADRSRIASILRKLDEWLEEKHAVCPDDPQPALMQNKIRERLKRRLGLETP